MSSPMACENNPDRRFDKRAPRRDRERQDPKLRRDENGGILGGSSRNGRWQIPFKQALPEASRLLSCRCGSSNRCPGLIRSPTWGSNCWSLSPGDSEVRLVCLLFNCFLFSVPPFRCVARFVPASSQGCGMRRPTLFTVLYTNSYTRARRRVPQGTVIFTGAL